MNPTCRGSELGGVVGCERRIWAGARLADPERLLCNVCYAKTQLPEELREPFEDLALDYGFIAKAQTGRAFVVASVLAELTRRGWRKLAPVQTRRERTP